MKRTYSLVPALVALSFTSCNESVENGILFPLPKQHECRKGEFCFSPFTVISVENEQQQEIAEWFAWLFAEPAGFVPIVQQQAEESDIELHLNEELPPEAYILDVSRRKIDIWASGPQGFFYAFQTLRFALPAEISSKEHADSVQWTLPAMSVEDRPGYSHRCLKLDLSRQNASMENIYEFLDCMALLKFNHLHLIMDFEREREKYELILDHAASLYISLTPTSACLNEFYSFSRKMPVSLFKDIAALSQIAWSGGEVTDVMSFNRAVSVLKRHLRYKALDGSDIVYNVSIAELR